MAEEDVVHLQPALHEIPFLSSIFEQKLVLAEGSQGVGVFEFITSKS